MENVYKHTNVDDWELYRSNLMNSEGLAGVGFKPAEQRVYGVLRGGFIGPHLDSNGKEYFYFHGPGPQSLPADGCRILEEI